MRPSRRQILASPVLAAAAGLEARRTWIGPEHWANPLQDWRVDNGWIIARSGPNRTLHWFTRELREGAFRISVDVDLDAARGNANVSAGFRIGVRGMLDDFRHALILANTWIDAGLRGDGRLTLDGKTGAEQLGGSGVAKLELTRDGGDLILRASRGDSRIETRARLADSRLRGNIALLASEDEEDKRPDVRFRDWSAAGAGIAELPDRAFGPILWTQYTLSRGVLKLTAQLPPVGDADSREVRLETRRGGRWSEIARATIDPLARVAAFRVANFRSNADVPYRAVYHWAGRDHYWEGTIRAEPQGRPLSIGVFSCDNGYAFPIPTLTARVKQQNPDLLYFAGDQIYEGYGGFGFARGPVPLAMLEYLRKYFQFGWTWRELLRDRPTVILPDDHDVFQGNLWGQDGRVLATKADKGFEFGGYKMDAEWVRAVERTQTAHLPDPVDPKPVQQGIQVYFTELVYGGVSFAIIEDRKFKTGPGSLELDRGGNVASLDVPGAQLLGPRQERFLKQWAARRDRMPKVVLSQTIFCKVTTHAGARLAPSRIDLDCNAWPQSGRRRALEALRGTKVVMLHGDQHVGALVHHGLDEWEDSAIAFMVPGTANGFPRAWWPEKEAPDGRYLDSFGHRMTVLGIANPDRGSNDLPRAKTHPEDLAHRKGSGHGIVRVDPRARTVTFEMWRYRDGVQFPGFPRTLNV